MVCMAYQALLPTKSHAKIVIRLSASFVKALQQAALLASYQKAYTYMAPHALQIVLLSSSQATQIQSLISVIPVGNIVRNAKMLLTATLRSVYGSRVLQEEH